MPGVHGSNAVLILGADNFSPYFKTASKSVQVENADYTTYAYTSSGTGSSKRFYSGLNDGTVTLEGMWDPALDVQMNAALTVAAATRLCTIGPQGMALGDPVWMFDGIITNYESTTPVADIVSATLEFQADGGIRTGICVLNAQSQSVTGTGTVTDNGAATTLGGRGHAQVLLNARTDVTVLKIQHSPDNSVWTDLITFTTVAAATRFVESQQVTGTVNRYLRASWTMAAGTGAMTITMSFARAA